MSDAARKLLAEVLSLPESERLELASEIIASVDGPTEDGWQSAWLREVDRRIEIAKTRGEIGSDWADARARILRRLGRT